MVRLSKRLVLSVVAIVALAVIALSIATPLVNTNRDNTAISVVLHLKVIDRSGKVKYDIVKDNDLLLKNFVRLIAFIFKYNADASVGKVRALSGSEIDLSHIETSDSTSHDCMILIGSGTTPPTLDDFTFQETKASFPATSITLVVSGNDMNLSITGSWVSTANISVTEIGLKVWIAPNAWYLVFRDVLDSPVTLNEGDTITVTYTIMFDNP